MPSSRRWACLIAAILEISACVDACSYVLVGKHAAADNAVLASYQNDYTGNTPIAVVPYMTKSPKKATQVKNQCSRAVIPPVPRGGTYASYAVTTPSIREAFLNSAGLAMNYGVYNYVRSEVTAADGFQSNGLGTELWDLVMERCSTPRQAVEMLVSLINECGASSMAAGSIGIFDKNEAWTLEIISGHHFAAQRVPDTKFLAQPNMLRIGELVFGPSTEFYTSPGLLEFAKSLGFAAASATTFNFAAAFNAENGNGRQHAKDRLWQMHHLLAPQLDLTLEMPSSEYPVFASASGRIALQDLRAVHRYHAEGTDHATDYSLMSPHNTEPTFCPVCRSIATYHVIWKFSQTGPAAMIVGACSGCTGAMIPYWVETVPMVWTSDISTTAASDPVFSLSLANFREIQHKMDATDNSGLPEYGQHIAGIKERQAVMDASVDAAVSQACASGTECLTQLLAYTRDIAYAVEDHSVAVLAQIF